MFLPRHEAVYATRTGYRFEWELFRRLMRFGLPNGVFAGVDTLAWTAFVTLVGGLGTVELAASTIAFTLNLIAYLPTMGIGQAVEVLVGQRLGENRPDLAERSVWKGLFVAMGFCAVVALLYLVVPGPLADLFQSTREPDTWGQVQPLVQPLLRFVCIYCIFDGMNLIFSFALRGAGDTRFVTYVALVLTWPLMVLPTWVACCLHAHLFWPWTFATLYIIALAAIYFFRFRQGLWKSMRVIEQPAIVEIDRANGVLDGTMPAVTGESVSPPSH
jgi:MATE family multidrug resistance protein